MSNVALADINSFASQTMQADFESPQITVPAQVLQDLLESIHSLEDRVCGLEDRTASLEEENAALSLKLASVEQSHEQDTNRICLDIAYDRQRLAKLEKVEPQPLQKDRAEILRALIAANGGKMLAKDARQKMRMDKGNFSRLLDTLKDDIDTKPLHQDKRRLLLIIK